MCHLLSLLRNEPSLKLFTLFTFSRTKILYSLQKLIFQERDKLDHALFRISFFNSLIKVLRIFLFLFAMKYLHFYNQLRWSGSLILINLLSLASPLWLFPVTFDFDNFQNLPWSMEAWAVGDNAWPLIPTLIILLVIHLWRVWSFLKLGFHICKREAVMLSVPVGGLLCMSWVNSLLRASSAAPVGGRRQRHHKKAEGKARFWTWVSAFSPPKLPSPFPFPLSEESMPEGSSHVWIPHSFPQDQSVASRDSRITPPQTLLFLKPLNTVSLWHCLSAHLSGCFFICKPWIKRIVVSRRLAWATEQEFRKGKDVEMLILSLQSGCQCRNSKSPRPTSIARAFPS